MKTIKNIGIYMMLFAICMSCEDYLDKVQDFEGLQEKDVFSDVQLASNYLDGAYTFLITETSAAKAKQSASDELPAMTMGGEGYPGRVLDQVPEIYDLYAQGDYLSLINWNPNFKAAPDFTFRYFEAWKGIRTVNTFLAKADQIKNGTPEEVDGLKGQAYFIRAFLYHMLTKRHGGLPYFKEPLPISESLDRERESYASNVENMLADLDQAIALLPTEWPPRGYGRPRKGAALALKSRITLFAASPLANTGNDASKWELAAKSAWDMIQHSESTGLYQMKDASTAIDIDVASGGKDLYKPEPNDLLPYRSIFVGPGAKKDIPQGVIFQELNADLNGPFKKLNVIPNLTNTVGFNIIKGNNQPMGIGALANFADVFETKNGLSIEDDPTYNDQNPFVNRDPRFYNAILYDGVAWDYTNGAINKTGKVDLAMVNEKGKRGVDLHDPTSTKLWRVLNQTGLMIRKWVPNGAWWRNGRNGSFDYYVNGIVMRMAEVYLNYAEAVNEAYGPNGTAPGASLTAVQAINKIRNRVGMPNVQAQYMGSKDIFRERIRNERAVELCFEGFHYDDIRRWKTADEEKNKVVKFLEMRWQGSASETYPTGFSFQEVAQPALKKTFTTKNYWWPIPTADLEAAPSFKQTPGW